MSKQTKGKTSEGSFVISQPRDKYSLINPLRWSKKHYKERENWKCEHRHSGVTHPRCFNKAFGIEERIGCLDIETSNLKADFGIVLSWAIKIFDKDELYYDVLTEADLRNSRFDKRMMETLINTLWKLDRVVTWFGRRFDVPFVRTRALHWKLPFPTYGMLWHTDAWSIARNKLCLHSNRQGNVARVIQGIDIKTKIHPAIWQTVQFGNRKARREALNYVLEHNERDVLQLEENYRILRQFVKEVRGSL